MKCFFAYFAPLFFYVKNLLQLSFQDLVFVGALMVSGTAAGISYLLDLNYFGVSNLLVLIVLVTIGANTYFGIKKSQLKSKEALAKATTYNTGPQRRLQMKLHQRYKFDWNKLQFVFFKALAFLTYLFVASSFLKEGEGWLDWTSAAIIQTPMAIHWYAEWKSIGDNSEYIYGTKARIFVITEFIFEAKFAKFFTPPKTPQV